MVTKAIIEAVETVKTGKNSVLQYTVRLPIFHGYNDSDATPTSQLPKAVYCTMPHMEQTKLCKGDIVWVAIEDFDLSQIVILGIIPTSSTQNLYGSAQTQSGISVENVQSFKSDLTGSVELPFNTKVWITTNENKITSGDDYVNGEEISYLKNVDSPIQDQINGVRNATYTISQRFSLQATLTTNSTTRNSGFVLDSETWVKNSGLLQLEYVYMFKFSNNTWSVVDERGKLRTYTREALGKQCGITYMRTSANATFTVVINMSPLAVEYGGTGADNAAKACIQLGTFQTQLVSESEFTSLASAENLKTSTVYYIYSEREDT